jgi:hypothetical protein
MTDDLNICELMRYSEDEISAKNYRSFNVFAVYILSQLGASQSMGLIGSEFKNPKAVDSMVSKRFPAFRPSSGKTALRHPPDRCVRPFPRHLGCVLLQHRHHDQGEGVAAIREAL